MKEELLYNKIYEKTKDYGRTQFVRLLMDKEREKQEILEYLKEKEKKLQNNVCIYEEKLRNTSKDDYYYNSHLKTIHKYNAQRELIKEILPKIEKR